MGVTVDSAGAAPTARTVSSEIQSLGYVGLASDRLDEWAGFASDLLGMQVADRSRHSVSLRMDDRRQRLMVDADRSRRTTYGWEVPDDEALGALCDRLEAAGVRHEPLNADALRRRFVTAGIGLADPAGNRVEIYYGALLDSEDFRPGRGIAGFKTGPLGLGHAVLTTPRVEPMLAFYRDLLGFRLSDYVERPFRAFFFHLNPRHHSLAIIEADSVGMHHLMVEMLMFDDVGQAYDLAEGRPEGIGVTLGRHTNDHMTSFYTNTPSPFMIECGWGGRTIDPDIWIPHELHSGPSLWGHDRAWLSEEKRREVRALQIAAASAGNQEPVHVTPGNFDVTEDCAWWAGLRGVSQPRTEPRHNGIRATTSQE